MAYEAIEPFGADWSEELINRICATIANFSVMMVEEPEGSGKRKLWSSKDFTPGEVKEEKTEPKKKQSVEQMKTALQAIAKAANKNQQKKFSPKKRGKANGG